MPTQFRYVSVPDFVQMTNSGSVDLETSKQNFKRLVTLWKQEETANVLVDVRKVRHYLSPADVHEFFELVKETGLGMHNLVAILYSPPAGFDAVRFLEFLAKQRGVGVKVCEDFEEAIEWFHTASPAA